MMWTNNHDTRSRIIKTAIVVAVCSLMCNAPHTLRASVMSGAFIISTQSNGNNTTSGQGSWDTVAENGTWNIWLNEGSFGGPFVNGPNDSQVGLNLMLHAGSYDFTFQFRGSDNGVRYFGLNLFFDGNNGNPGISTFGRINTTAAGNQPFWANGAPETPALDGSTVPGAGTLTYINGPTTVSLTNFQIYLPIVFNQDRIGAFSTHPDFGFADEYVGQFSLTVVNDFNVVPEPSPIVIWFVGMGALLGVSWLRDSFAKTVNHRCTSGGPS